MLHGFLSVQITDIERKAEQQQFICPPKETIRDEFTL